jgi:hypothetical protein
MLFFAIEYENPHFYQRVSFELTTRMVTERHLDLKGI